MERTPHKKLASGREVFQVYFQHVKRYPLLLTAVILGAIGLQVTDLAAPWFLRQFFNTLATNTPAEEVVTHLLGIVSIIALIWFANWATRRMLDFSVLYLESGVMTDLYSSAFEYLIAHSYNFFTSRFAGSLTHKVSKFVRGFESMFDAISGQFFPTLLFVSGAVTILFLRNHMLGIALGVWSVCFVAFQIYVSRLRQPVRETRSEADTRVTGALADSISNHPTIVLFSGEKHEHGLFNSIVDVWRKATLRSWTVDNAIWAGIGLFMIGIEVGLLAGATVLWGRGLIQIGDFVLIQSYLLVTFDRLVSINRELRRFHDAFADSSEMVAMLNMPHEVEDVGDAKQLIVNKGSIDFKNVEFHFHKDTSVLKSLNLHITAGKKVAFVGPSGAGKSTMTKLLLRMFDISGGVIEIDGQDISKVTQNSLRDAISFVPQEPILFHRSLMENIRYGRRDATDEEVIVAAQKANCHEFISGLHEGYNTFVGERGIKLSGGERQRVAIARAILKDAPILLLDEATSSLDSESEGLIQDALATTMQGKTVIVIAHRLSTIMRMDRIVVLDHGRVIEQGTHQELLKTKGLYNQLWTRQAGGFIPDDEEEVSN